MQILIFNLVLVIVDMCVGTEVISFKSFQLQHNKVYQSNEELSLREQIFKRNVLEIEKHNQLYDQGLTTYRMGVNKFTDMTPDEFSSMLKTIPLSNVSFKQDASANNMELYTLKPPVNIDWRENGMISAVKDQGNCGSCWAFSVTGAVEAQIAISQKSNVILSEQELVDCEKRNNGCNGGALIYAYQYVKETGLTYEDEYPYQGVKNYECKNVKRKAVKLSSFSNITPYNETQLISVVGNIGPASVAINADKLQNYQSGVFNELCSNVVNHGVLVVGYNTEQNYWILKNSWGPNWGEKGYFRLAMGSGLCGIASQAYYPTKISSGSSKIHFFNVSVASLISGIIYMIRNK
ncbi:cathepsin L-like proteinase [Euwallacea fornicatus]|uniref:cathepsin L-like proteinase n=1 Tax=Euwallacea fornicatus TaxID=995702 RepID=UPI00338EC50B